MRHKVQLSFHDIWAYISKWPSKERQLEEVQTLFSKHKISNLTKIKLKQQIVFGSAEGMEGTSQ